MKIGILGTRGIPNAYGGFEQFVQFLAPGLVKRGHEVFVYCSSLHPYTGNEWMGVQLIRCSDAEDSLGTAGQFYYDFNCLTDARKRGFNVLLQLGYTSNSVWHFRWPSTINIVNMDGLEWRRSKYNKAVRWFLQWAESLAARHADVLIADSPGIQDHIKLNYGRNAVYIPYAAEIPDNYDVSYLKELDLEPSSFSLVISRLEPENHVEEIIRGFVHSGNTEKLVIVGNTTNNFGSSLKARYSGSRIVFTEGIYDITRLNTLRHFSKLYFHGHSVGGTNPSLLEAMACECLIIAHNNPFNKAVLGNDAGYFENHEQLSNTIQQIQNNPVGQWKANNLKKIRDYYNWPAVIDAYENLFLEVAAIH